MKQVYVVLRVPWAARNVRGLKGVPGLDGSVAVAMGDAAPHTLNLVELSDRERETVRNERDVAVVAPAMPITLIAPIARSSALPVAEAAGTGDSWGIAAVGADRTPSTGQGVVVAVLDTGIDETHPAFQGVEIVGRNFTQGGVNAFGDTDGHGTHCAGTIFGRDVQGRRIGVARGVTRALVGKVIGSHGGGSSAQIAEAVQWAVSEGAHVISMSLGIDFPGYIARLEASNIPTLRAYSMGLSAYRENLRLFDRLASLVAVSGNPTLFVAAAGNESQRDGNPAFELDVGYSCPTPTSVK